MSEVAWAAGFFDGEGSLSTYLKRRGSLSSIVVTMSLTQKDRRPLDKFQRAVGAGAIYFIKPTARPERVGWWTWQLRTVKRIQPVMDMLWPYLCEPKQEQWAAVLDRVTQHKAGLTYGRGKRRRLDNTNGVAVFSHHAVETTANQSQSLEEGRI